MTVEPNSSSSEPEFGVGFGGATTVVVVVDALLTGGLDLGTVLLVLNDGVEVEVHAVGDQEAEPLHGEVPVLELVVLGDVVALGESLVGVDHGGVVVEEGDDLHDVDNDKADHVDVVHNAAPDNEEPVDTIVVGGAGEDPDNGSRDPHTEHGEGVDVLREAPHGVGVHSDDTGSEGSGGILTWGSVPELVIVVLEPVEGEGDGGGSEHSPGGELLFIPGLHAVLDIKAGGVRVHGHVALSGVIGESVLSLELVNNLVE